VKCLDRMFPSLFCFLLTPQGYGLVHFSPQHQLHGQKFLSKQGTQHGTESLRGYRQKVFQFGVGCLIRLVVQSCYSALIDTMIVFPSFIDVCSRSCQFPSIPL